MRIDLVITTPGEIARLRTYTFEVAAEDHLAVVHVAASADGNPDWGMPFRTAVTVAAEVWRDGMDDDGDGEPVTDAAGIAALLGCSPEGLAAHLDEMVCDRALAAYEARYDY